MNGRSAARWKACSAASSDLNAIGAALSSERDINRLLESILSAARKITNADAGTSSPGG